MSARVGDWLAIRADGGFDVLSGKVEIGQGISAALVKVACLELGVDPDQVHLVAGDTLISPNEGYTAGSQSIEVGAFALRRACQSLRHLCAAQASRRLGVDGQGLSVSHGLFSTLQGNTVIGYADLLRDLDWRSRPIDADGTVPQVDAQVQRDAHQRFERTDLLRKLSGGGFVHDLQIKGMVHARVLRGPHPASRPRSVDVAAIERLAGVDRFIRQADFLALVGTDEARIVAAAASAKLLIEWTTPVLSACTNTEQVLTNLPATTSMACSHGTAPEEANTRRLRRRYSRPYLAHAAIGPSCAVAEPTSEPGAAGIQITVWSHTQGAFQLRAAIARGLALETDAVRVIHTPGAGCYGHNGADDVAFDAALLARILGKPVRVQWMRDDEMSVAPMGAASLVELDAGLDAQGRISDWNVQVWSHSHIARPGWGEGINLLGAWASNPALRPSAPADVPLPSGGALRNAIPGYSLPALIVQHHFVPDAPMRVSALRSLGAHANVFAIESFMDELAALADADPLAFRLKHLSDARARHVIETAARLANWSERSSGGEGRGLGLGFARYKNHAGFFAVVIEVEVEESVKVRRVWAAIDAGAIVHRDGLLNQIEGGIVQALSWALKEAVTWGPQGILSTNWDAYPILGFAELPEVFIELLDRPDEPSLGVGEVAPGPVAGALGNAIAHALGVRPRHLPFTAERLLGLVQADESSGESMT